MAEQLMKIKNNHQHKTQEKIKNNSTNQAITQRTKMGVASWHTHKNRAIQSALIWLRSGHNKLNGTISKWDMDIQPEWPHGCPEIENSTHVLLHCPHYSAARRELKLEIEKLKLPFDVPTLTGVNFSIPVEILFVQ
jgi:hypothetical protein